MRIPSTENSAKRELIYPTNERAEEEIPMKKLLPPYLFLLFIVGMPVVCWALEARHNMPYPYNLAGLPLLVIGLGMAVWGKKMFKNVRTNIKTFNDPDRLVTGGLYRFTRNPMYLGFAIALFGVAFLYQGGVSSFAMALLFLIIADSWYIRYEERALTRKFGREYEEYCKTTRRWI